jgi:hypothetical protein
VLNDVLGHDAERHGPPDRAVLGSEQARQRAVHPRTLTDRTRPRKPPARGLWTTYRRAVSVARAIARR